MKNKKIMIQALVIALAIIGITPGRFSLRKRLSVLWSGFFIPKSNINGRPAELALPVSVTSEYW